MLLAYGLRVFDSVANSSRVLGTSVGLDTFLRHESTKEYAMINRLAGLGFASLLSVACAHPNATPEDNTPVIGKMHKADKSFVLSDPDSKQRCNCLLYTSAAINRTT